MVINDRDIGCTDARPTKTNAIPIVDSNRELSGSISAQGLEPISWRHPELIQTFSRF